MEEIVVVANRLSGSISFIDTNTNQVIKTLEIAGSDPMYVVYVPSKDKIYVGDRKANKVHIINPDTKALENSINVGKGVFHMWANGGQLWIIGDIDKTISVLDLNTNSIIKTINVGLTPHDIFLTKDGTKAFVSAFNPVFGQPDSVLMYSIKTFEKTGEVTVGQEPHLFHLSSTNKLYVACQSGQLYILNGNDLTTFKNTAYEGAHGIFASPDQNSIFMTNITGAQIFSANATTGTSNGSPLNTPIPTPHNIVLNEVGNKMFVTHSGPAANTVTTYSVNASTLSPGTTITVGNNPFGITYYKRANK
ncbi:YncE family protein [Chryseobacterium sp. MP_3.2]|uniref:YncE family protein n=1 Tax=Chryseobacterium sp. MP_3.2 TaxID=3071712 RepID=UPI002E0EBC20